AYRVPGNLRDEVLSYLRERELVTSVYLERMLDVRLGRNGKGKGEGVSVEAVAYIVDRRHEQYAGALDADHAARIVRGAVGQSGRNEDYVLSTLEHLEALGIRDHWLEEVGRQVSPS
ncbi:MAG: gamma-glutamylcyclotransferase, partial [Mesorhizobium sp.]